MIELEPSLHFNSSGIDYVYKLISVVYHHGSTPHSGHYTADILRDSNWIKMDDDQAIPTMLRESSSAYILVYYIT